MAKFDSLKFQVYRSNAMRQALDSFRCDLNVQKRGIDVSQVSLEPITPQAIDASAYWEPDMLYPWIACADLEEARQEKLRHFNLVRFGVVRDVFRNSP